MFVATCTPQRLVAFALFMSCSCLATECHAQFLEKLEQAVRKQLEGSSAEEQEPSQSSGELPPPNQEASESSRAATAADAPEGGRGDSKDAKSFLPSILDSDIFVPEPDGVGGSQPSSADRGDEENRRSRAGSPDSGAAAGEQGSGYLGLEAEELSDGGFGVGVTSVTEQSPAWKAGFRPGDRILAIEGTAITDLQAMSELLARHSAGDPVRFLVARGSNSRELTAVLMDPELAEEIQRRDSIEVAENRGRGWLGAVVADLSGPFRQQFGIGAYRGAAVTSVARGSPAARGGIRPGDAIIGANGEPIDSAHDLTQWVRSKQAGDRVELIVYRGGESQNVTVQLGNEPDDPRASPLTFPPVPPAASFGLRLLDNLGIANPEAGQRQTQRRGLGRRETDPRDRSSIDQLPAPDDTAADGGAGDRTALSESELDALRTENARLRAELSEARTQLEETQRSLNAILDQLQRNRRPE